MGFVDPDLLGKWERCRLAVDEAFGVSRVSRVEYQLTLVADEFGLAVMHHGWRQQADAGVTVIVVVPGKECRAEGAAVGQGTEAIGKLRAILHGAEVAFRIRIVVGGVWPRVGLGDAQVGQQESHGFGAHRRAAVGVDGELTGRNILLGAGFFDQSGSQCGGFAQRHHPADDVAAEDIQNHVQIKIGPLGGAAQLGDVLAPQLIRLSG